MPRDALATRHGANVSAIVGDDLLKENFPLIHAVGRAADRAPRLIDMTWGDPSHPKITLIGKGVCFDTGGLDIKPESGMLNMKKDMGGAATMLALAHMLMGRGIKIRLRVLMPAVENSIAGSAFRPRDIYRSRKGITVEIGNTDAEGRLILADALALADEEKPELIADMATLTGAARVALGTEVVPFYTDDDALAAELARCAGTENDPLWRMPLWRPYDQLLEFEGRRHQQRVVRRICRLDHRRAVPAPFRQRRQGWLHFDIYAWNQTNQARPAGRRRMPGRARALCAAGRALWLMPRFDPRITPAAGPRGQASEGRSQRASSRRAREVATAGAVRRALADAPLDTEALKGERVTVYETTAEGWVLGPARGRRLCRLAAGECAARRRVPRRPTRSSALRTLVFPGPSIKLPPVEALSLGCPARDCAHRGAVRGDRRPAATCRRVILRRVAVVETDLVAVAERFLGVPYLWGGKTSLRPRLLGAGAGCAHRLRHRLPARQRHAGRSARHAAAAHVRSRRRCGAATWCSGKAMSPSCATPRRSFTPMPFTWRLQSSRSKQQSRASAPLAAT